MHACSTAGFLFELKRFYNYAKDIDSALFVYLACTVHGSYIAGDSKGIQKERGHVQLTINPTCKQKLKPETECILYTKIEIVICIYFSTAPFGFCLSSLFYMPLHMVI